MAKPKLALIPASQGSKVFSVLPSSGVGDFDFTRASTATRVNSQGLIEEVANGQSRLEYPLIDGVVSGCPSLLLEPSRTNLFPYSEDFSEWLQTETINTDNEIISPDGTLNASLITEDATLNTKFTFLNLTTTTNIHTLSFFAKYKGRYLQILFGTGDVSGNPHINFDLQNGTYSNNGVTNPSIQNFGNGWYKISLSITPIVTSDFGVLFSPIPSLTSSRLTSYQGDGTSGVYVWGSQLEEGSYATSYIPTNGTAVTRAAETANGAGDASTFNDSEGVLMAEISALADDLTYRSISIGSGTGVINLFYSNVSNTIVASSAGGALIINQLSDITNFNKVVFKYKQNDFSLWVNGFEIGTDISGTTGNALTTLSFDNNAGGSIWYGKTKQLQYYNTALTDSELEILTSWTSFTEMAQGQQYSII